MSKDYSFSVMPSVSISRSRFARKSQHKTSFNLGKIVPIYCDEVLPGDTRSIDMAAVVRMSTPIAPIMDNIFIDYFAFFVPNRLVWEHWKEFMGENNSGAGIPVVSYSCPVAAATASPFQTGSLGDYLGLPIGVNIANNVSALPFRGYALIYNEWFRNQNVIAPLAVSKADSNVVLVNSTTSLNFISDPAYLPVAAKPADYFTKALPYAQKGAAVTIPLGTEAPVIGSASMHSVGLSGLRMESGLGHSATQALAVAGSSAGDADKYKIGAAAETATLTSSGNFIDKTNLVADLRNATAATINDLRYAFQLQKLLEKDALYGTRYWEILASHFGIKAPDASLQRPEYLGGYRQHINIDQVLTTAGYDDTSAQEVGKPGANSVTGFKGSIFTKSFTEHGYLFILAVARHDQTYSQGINRMWSKRNRFDYYFPVFANLGAQDIRLREIYAAGIGSDNNIFGYQEAWAEYRYKPSICTGLLNPNATGSLDYWTLSNKFASAPTLGQVFIEQSRDNLARALVTGVTGPDFIADFYFEDIAVRPMPMYSIPGLIDHH